MDLGLRDRVVVVTGGGSGIGAGIARACLEEGARVVVAGRRTAAVEAFARETAGTRCEVVEGELGAPGVCEAVVRGVEARYGEVYGLVNNAGGNDGVGLEAGSPERFAASLLGNVGHFYEMAHFALPALKRSGGSIVNVASKVAVTGQGGTSGYAAAKGAALALTREWAVELLPSGVRVNAVVPAEVMTPLYETWLATLPDAAEQERRIAAGIPLGGRMTTAEEIAAAVVFLLSGTKSGHTTGQHVYVDGGYVHLDRALVHKTGKETKGEEG